MTAEPAFQETTSSSDTAEQHNSLDANLLPVADKTLDPLSWGYTQKHVHMLLSKTNSTQPDFALLFLAKWTTVSKPLLKHLQEAAPYPLPVVVIDSEQEALLADQLGITVLPALLTFKENARNKLLIGVFNADKVKRFM